MCHSANPRLRGQGDGTGLQRKLSADQAEQGGFAGAIAAHDTDLVTGWDSGRGLLHKGAAFDGIGNVIDPKHEVSHVERDRGGQSLSVTRPS